MAPYEKTILTPAIKDAQTQLYAKLRKAIAKSDKDEATQKTATRWLNALRNAETPEDLSKVLQPTAGKLYEGFEVITKDYLPFASDDTIKKYNLLQQDLRTVRDVNDRARVEATVVNPQATHNYARFVAYHLDRILQADDLNDAERARVQSYKTTFAKGTTPHAVLKMHAELSRILHDRESPTEELASLKRTAEHKPFLHHLYSLADEGVDALLQDYTSVLDQSVQVVVRGENVKNPTLRAMLFTVADEYQQTLLDNAQLRATVESLKNKNRKHEQRDVIGQAEAYRATDRRLAVLYHALIQHQKKGVTDRPILGEDGLPLLLDLLPASILPREETEADETADDEKENKLATKIKTKLDSLVETLLQQIHHRAEQHAQQKGETQTADAKSEDEKGRLNVITGTLRDVYVEITGETISDDGTISPEDLLSRLVDYVGRTQTELDQTRQLRLGVDEDADSDDEPAPRPRLPLDVFIKELDDRRSAAEQEAARLREALQQKIGAEEATKTAHQAALDARDAANAQVLAEREQKYDELIQEREIAYNADISAHSRTIEELRQKVEAMKDYDEIKADKERFAEFARGWERRTNEARDRVNELTGEKTKLAEKARLLEELALQHGLIPRPPEAPLA